MFDDAITEVDVSFDRYARLVRRMLGVPVALVSLAELDGPTPVRQRRGPDTPLGPRPVAVRRLPPDDLTRSLGGYVVEDGVPLVVRDARSEPRLVDHPAVAGHRVVAYAGWPLVDHAGDVVGALSAVEHQPRVWTDSELEGLADLAAACSAELSQRGLQRIAMEQADFAVRASHRHQVLLALSEALATTRTLGDVSSAIERAAIDLLGCVHAGIWVRQVGDPMNVPPPRPRVSETPERLSYVSDPSAGWPQASRFAVVGVDRTNPLGEALLSDQAVYFSDMHSLNQRYPVLVGPVQDGGARAIAPLAVGGQAYGALALLWPEDRTFSIEDRVTVSALTSYTAQAVQRAFLLQERVEVAETLQRALLSRLPRPAGLELAGRYRPAAARQQVGGDWYDAVETGPGETSVMVGDVVGHDIAAAAVMGQLRSMLRAFAYASDEAPSRNVERLDRALLDLGVETMATLVYARVETSHPGSTTVRWTNAGHLPPLLLDPAGRARLLDDGSADCMLGVAPDLPRHDRTTEIAPGSTLLLFTDGLAERRGESLDVGLERVRRSAARHHRKPVADLLDAMLAELVAERPDDDTALLAIRFG